MTWDAYHRRKRMVREMLSVADRDLHPSLADLLDHADPQRTVLADESAALFEIQMIWFHRLSGHVDRLAAEGGEAPETVTIAAWAAAAADLPGARRLLDAHGDSPDLATAFTKERAFIAASAGLPTHHPDLGRHGQRIIAVARADTRWVDGPRVAAPATEHLDDTQRPGLIARLRNALAA